MRNLFALLFSILAVPVAAAQCFDRNACDASTYEIRSQLSVTIPSSDQASPADAVKAMADAQQKLSVLSDREYEAIKSTYGADAALRSASTNSNMQQNGYRGSTAYVSVSNTYAVKRPAK